MAVAVSPASTLATGLRNLCTQNPNIGRGAVAGGGLVNDATALAVAVIGGAPA